MSRDSGLLFSSPRVRRLAFVLLSFLLAAPLLTAQSGAGTRPETPSNPWSLYNFEDGELNVLPPVCHALSYFSGPPKRFDYSNRLEFLANNYGKRKLSWNTHADLVGSAQGHKIYEVLQEINFKPPYPGFGSAPPASMRRVMAERAPGEYCMFFQFSNEFHTVVELDPVELISVAGGTVLYSHDQANGNCGCYFTEAWVIEGGVPYYLDFESLIAAELKRLLPSGDEVRDGDPLDVSALIYTHEVSTPRDSEHEASGGTVTIGFTIHGHTLSVASSSFAPPGK